MLIIHSKFCWNFLVDSLRSCVLCWPELDGWPWWSLIRFSCDHLGGILQKMSWKDFDTKHFICPLLRLWLLVSIFFVVLLSVRHLVVFFSLFNRAIQSIILWFFHLLSLDCFTSSNNIENWIEIHPSEQHSALEPPLSFGVFFRFRWAQNIIFHTDRQPVSCSRADGLERNDADVATLETRKKL